MTAQRLHDLAARFWDFQREEYPISAIFAGQPVEGDLLLREAPADHARRAEWAARARAELATIDAAPLDLDDRATHAMLGREFDLLIDGFACGAHLRPPLYPLGPDYSLQYWGNSTAIATKADAERYLARLRTIPAAMAGLQESLREGVKRGFRYPRLVILRAAEQARGMLAMPPEAHPLAGPFARARSHASAIGPLAEAGRAYIADTLYPLFHDHADFIERELGAVARDGLACTEDAEGEAFYAYMIGSATTLSLDAHAIHETGLAEVARIEGEMRQVAIDAGCGGDIAEFRRRLMTDNSQFAESGEALREQIEILSKRIDARIPEFFGRVPRTTYGVQSIPEAIAEKMPPAYAQPNPADGSAAGVHWITSIPGKCPRYMHLPLALHEAWPGHLMHLALMQEMDHLPAFRRYGAMRYSACLEGWALYSEALGEEMGFYDTPEKRYGRLEMEMWRAVRLVLDTGIHAKGWSREQAIDFFKRNMAMPDTTIEAETDRYIAWPGQALAYQLGNLAFRAVRQRAQAELGDEFRIRDFHDALMAAGPVTLPVLDDLMAEWTGRQRVSEMA